MKRQTVDLLLTKECCWVETALFGLYTCKGSELRSKWNRRVITIDGLYADRESVLELPTIPRIYSCVLYPLIGNLSIW